MNEGVLRECGEECGNECWWRGRNNPNEEENKMCSEETGEKNKQLLLLAEFHCIPLFFRTDYIIQFLYPAVQSVPSPWMA